MIRLHLGAGASFLRDWVNIDAGPHVRLAAARPDLVRKLATTEDRYYLAARGPTEFLAGPADQETVADVIADIRRLPYGPETVDEILACQVAEHIAVADRGPWLDHLFAILKPGGLLRLTVPDVEGETNAMVRSTRERGPDLLAVLHRAEDEVCFGVRHILGSRKDEYSYHLSAFTSAGLAKMLADWGFVNVHVSNKPLANQFQFAHAYPSLYAVAVRPREYMTRAQYQDAIFGGWGLSPQHGGDRVVDIGGGRAFHPRADLVVDVDEAALEEAKRSVAVLKADVRDLPFADKEWDFAICSHVIEHMPTADDIRRACSELVRVAKRGYIECPNHAKEWFAGTPITQPDHYWFVDEIPGGLWFRRITDEMRAAISVQFEAAMSRILRLSSTPTRDERIVRQHFWRNQRHFNACLVFDGPFEVMITE